MFEFLVTILLGLCRVSLVAVGILFLVWAVGNFPMAALTCVGVALCIVVEDS